MLELTRDNFGGVLKFFDKRLGGEHKLIRVNLTTGDAFVRARDGLVIKRSIPFCPKLLKKYAQRAITKKIKAHPRFKLEKYPELHAWLRSL